MQMKQRTVTELVGEVLAKMAELDYKETTIVNYKRFYRHVIEFAEEKGALYYSEELGSKFLARYYSCHIDTFRDKCPEKRLRPMIRYIRVLGDYQIHGIILRRKLGPLAVKECPEQFYHCFKSYQEECEKRGLSEQGCYTRLNRIKHFLFYLQEHQITDPEKITPEIISEYVKTFINLSSKSVQANLVAVRCFLRHIYLKGFTTSNLSEKVPAQKNYYTPKIPCIWKLQEVRAVLETIDRGNPTGKRDYAILLMVTRLGLRASDIKALRFKNIKWDTNTIEIIQHKTRNAVVLPLLKDIGWALIEYLKNGRPQTASDHVFVRHNAPYEEFAPNAAMNRILVKYIRQAGVKIKRDVPLGLHSLRHTLASTMLAQDVPLETISEVLGHMSVKSTDIYLHIDFKRLWECALDADGVACHE